MGRREVIQFEDSTGLGIRVSQTGQISFIVQLKLKDGSRHRETLGAYGKLTIEAARKAAQAIAGKIAMGVDLQHERAEAEAKAKAKAEAEEAKKFTVGGVDRSMAPSASQRPTPRNMRSGPSATSSGRSRPCSRRRPSP